MSSTLKILFDEGASDDEGASEDDDDDHYYYDVVVGGDGDGDGMLMLMLMNFRSISLLHGRACHLAIPPSTLMIFPARNLHLDSLHQFSHYYIYDIYIYNIIYIYIKVSILSGDFPASHV